MKIYLLTYDYTGAGKEGPPGDFSSVDRAVTSKEEADKWKYHGPLFDYIEINLHDTAVEAAKAWRGPW